MPQRVQRSVVRAASAQLARACEERRGPPPSASPSRKKRPSPSSGAARVSDEARQRLHSQPVPSLMKCSVSATREV